MGRVNATVQTAIYGVRPLGALAGGIVGPRPLQAALVLIAVAFVLSTLVIVLSPLARLRAATAGHRLDYWTLLQRSLAA